MNKSTSAATHKSAPIADSRPNPALTAFFAGAVSTLWLAVLSVLPKRLRTSLISSVPKAPPLEQAKAQALEHPPEWPATSPPRARHKHRRRGSDKGRRAH